MRKTMAITHLARIQQEIRNEQRAERAPGLVMARFLPTPFLTVPMRPHGPVHHVFPGETGDSRSHTWRSYTSVQQGVEGTCGNFARVADPKRSQDRSVNSYLS